MALAIQDTPRGVIDAAEKMVGHIAEIMVECEQARNYGVQGAAIAEKVAAEFASTLLFYAEVFAQLKTGVAMKDVQDIAIGIVAERYPDDQAIKDLKSALDARRERNDQLQKLSEQFQKETAGAGGYL